MTKGSVLQRDLLRVQAWSRADWFPVEVRVIRGKLADASASEENGVAQGEMS